MRPTRVERLSSPLLSYTPAVALSAEQFPIYLYQLREKCILFYKIFYAFALCNAKMKFKKATTNNQPPKNNIRVKRNLHTQKKTKKINK